MRENIARMQPYVPGEQPDAAEVTKLNTNESPYPPSPAVVKALLKEAWGPLNLYPDPTADAIRDRLAERFGLARGNFLVGNGGDDILTIVTRCTCGEEGAAAYPVPTYILYETLADIQGARKIEVPFPDDFSLPEDLFANAAALTFLANPNSPSGTSVEPDEVRRLAGGLDGLLLVDEAYADFADFDCMDLVGEVPNLCLLRSFSKSFGMAGLRLGYLAGSEGLVSELVKAKDSYNVNRLTIAAGAAALDDYDYMLQNAARIRQTRQKLTRDLANLGFETLPSQSNFVWTRVPAPGAARVYGELKKRGILVRFWDRPRMSDFLRITVGEPRQIERLLDELSGIVEA